MTPTSGTSTHLCEALFPFGLDLDEVACNDDLFQLGDIDFFVIFSLSLLLIFIQPLYVASVCKKIDQLIKQEKSD